ncbi:MAG: hypothetical protein LBT75_02375, partial [Bacilli bacterium]|nr:hypothetical protein [Bacilli bacterium]
MDKVNEKVFELLKEIDDLCVKNNIRYYLSGNIALHIRNHKVLPSGAYYAKITMTKTNLFKFINLFENKKNENR